ncbi:MAG: hypothetical protein HYX27_18750 [Acidobacteria bacterium]|nr:hypothetical protein [Acidobacteriota bacterium]
MIILLASSVALGDPRVDAFTQRVNDYVKIRQTVNQNAPGLPKNATPAQIDTHVRALSAGIRTARAGAQPGDVFVAECRPLFFEILKANFQGASKQQVRATARQGNPARDKEATEAAPVIQVNGVYPFSAPLSTVPPALLLQLPKLPKDVEYRFSGNTLLLLDTASNLIIDYLKGAAPGL